jgi:hypothetical protein
VVGPAGDSGRCADAPPFSLGPVSSYCVARATPESEAMERAGRQTAVQVRCMDEASPSLAREPFARWLEAELRARRLSRRGLARRSGVDHSTIVRLLCGQRDPPWPPPRGSPRRWAPLADG